MIYNILETAFICLNIDMTFLYLNVWQLIGIMVKASIAGRVNVESLGYCQNCS